MPDFPAHLSVAEVAAILEGVSRAGPVPIERIRYKNRAEIVSRTSLPLPELLALIATAIEEGHLPGGDLRIGLSERNQVLIGHHDGVFWLESP
jgi:hypothetical protein